MIELYEEGQPWERIKRETHRAFAAFNEYRKLPAHKRSIRNAVIELYGEASAGKVRQFQKWSSRWQWVWRVGQWDDYAAEQSRFKEIEEIRAMNARHIDIGKALQQKAIMRLKAMGEDVMELTMVDVVRFIQQGISLERMAYGEPSEIIDERKRELHMIIEGELTDFTELTDEELRRMLAKDVTPNHDGA